MSNELLAFSDRQQAAVIGHTFLDPGFVEQLQVLKVGKTWFQDAEQAVIWELAERWQTRYTRWPMAKELAESFSLEEPKYRAAWQATIDFTLIAAAEHPVDVLRVKLRAWARSRVLVNRTHELRDKFNAGDQAAAEAAAEAMHVDLLKVEAATDGPPDRFEAAPIRVAGEEEQRIKESQNLLSYGISYMDDVTGGIIPHEVILIAAKTGVGKTQGAARIAAHNAATGKDIYAFFLEAEDGEIERRIKFGMLGKKYRKAHPGQSRQIINYADWRMAKLEKELRPYKTAVEREFTEKYSTLHTYYRSRGDFRIQEMDREVLRVHRKAKLIILDHIHFVDFEGNDENSEQGKFMKRIRNLAIGLGVPFICICHIRKGDGRGPKSLIPDIDAIHGSSNISKVATTAFMLGRANGLVVTDSRAIGGYPTFMRCIKNRLDGTRINPVAVSYYDPESGGYAKDYSIGDLSWSEDRWTPRQEEIPHWAKNATITDVSEVGK